MKNEVHSNYKIKMITLCLGCRILFWSFVREKEHDQSILTLAIETHFK